MSDLKLTRSFVKKLSMEIRAAYGKNVAHTKVLELVASAAGRDVGSLMHQLKNDGGTKRPGAAPLSTTTFSKRSLLALLNAAVAGERATVRAYLDLVDFDGPLAKLVLGIARYSLGYNEWYYEAPLLRAFRDDPNTVLLVASSVCDFEGNLFWDACTHFGLAGDEVGSTFLGSKLPVVAAAKLALAEGYLRFDGPYARLLSPSSARPGGQYPEPPIGIDLSRDLDVAMSMGTEADYKYLKSIQLSQGGSRIVSIGSPFSSTETPA